MGLYQVTDNSLKPLTKTSFPEEEIHEKRDLQKWLIANISVIGDDLLVIAEEFGDFKDSRRRIDILAVDNDANLVVIELKRTEDGGHMDLQAIRYAAMVANMTWSRAVDAFQDYLGEPTEDDQEETNAEKRLLEFLGWEESKPDDFAQSVKIILASADFSTEITATVLWLNEVGLDIQCIRLSLHKLGGDLILSADQIIPLPEAEDYLQKGKQKKQEEHKSKSSKDYSKYSISYEGEVYEESFSKTDTGYYTVRLLNYQGLINDEVFHYLRTDKFCAYPFLRKISEMTDKSRYRTTPNHQPLSYKGEDYYVASNWGVGNVEAFIEKIQGKFPKITFKKETK